MISMQTDIEHKLSIRLERHYSIQHQHDVIVNRMQIFARTQLPIRLYFCVIPKRNLYCSSSWITFVSLPSLTFFPILYIAYGCLLINCLFNKVLIKFQSFSLSNQIQQICLLVGTNEREIFVKYVKP